MDKKSITEEVGMQKLRRARSHSAQSPARRPEEVAVGLRTCEYSTRIVQHPARLPDKEADSL